MFLFTFNDFFLNHKRQQQVAKDKNRPKVTLRQHKAIPTFLMTRMRMRMETEMETIRRMGTGTRMELGMGMT